MADIVRIECIDEDGDGQVLLIRASEISYVQQEIARGEVEAIKIYFRGDPDPLRIPAAEIDGLKVLDQQVTFEHILAALNWADRFPGMEAAEAAAAAGARFFTFCRPKAEPEVS